MNITDSFPDLLLPSPLERIQFSDWLSKGNEVFIKRDDLIHSEISGNKWRKLKYNLSQVTALQKKGIITAGGPFSNHLAASFYAASSLGLEMVALVRGSERYRNNSTLSVLDKGGAQLIFLPKEEYDGHLDKEGIESWKEKFPELYWVPEGGENFYGMSGCMEITKEIDDQLLNSFNHIVLACGTGTTTAGILASLKGSTKVHSIAVMKENSDLKERIKQLLNYAFMDEEFTSELLQPLELHLNMHRGGYASFDPLQIQFMRSFFNETGIKTDPVYTGKALFALDHLIREDIITSGQKVLFIHTGGLQGNPGFENRYGIKLFSE